MIGECPALTERWRGRVAAESTNSTLKVGATAGAVVQRGSGCQTLPVAICSIMFVGRVKGLDIDR